MKNHPPRREIPEWSPRVEFDVTEVELKVEEVVELKEDHKVDMMGDLLLGGRSEWPTRDRPCQGKTLLLM